MRNIAKVTFFFSIIFLTFIFIFAKHYIDLSETIETWMTYKGLAYYKDFSVYHFPLGRISLLPIHLLFNWSFIDSPFIGLFMGIGILSLLYFFGKRIFSQSGTSLSLLFFTIFWWYLATQVIYDHEMMMGLFLTFSLVTFFSIYQSNLISLKKLFLLGIFSSLTLLTGQLSAITVTTLIFIALILVKIKKYKNKIAFPKTVLWVFLGFIIPLTIVLLYIVKIDALYDFYKWNIPYYLTYASDTKQSIFQLPWKELLIYYSPMLILSIFSLLDFLKNRKINSMALILIILNIATLPFNLFSVFHPRHLLYSLPLVAITAGFIINHKYIQKSIEKKITFLWIVSIILLFSTVIFPYYKNHFIYPPTLRIYNDIFPGDTTYETTYWIKDNTPKNSTIMVLGTPIIYVRADRLPASRPNRGIPYSWEPINEVKQEIQANPPDHWIVDQQFVTRLRTNYPTFNVTDFIDNEMLNCYTIQKTFNKWQIWKKDPSCKTSI